MAIGVTRRAAILRGLAGATILAAGGVVWRAWSNGVFHAGEGPAYQPWHDWRTAKVSGPLAIVQAGILASSAHNTQPWRFQVSDEQIALFADHERNLGALDPYRREMVLSLGCALENMMLAAGAGRFEPGLELPPGRLSLGPPPVTDEPVAVIQLKHRERRENELFDAIARRHTHRGSYQADRTLPPGLQDEMQGLVTDASEIRLFVFGDGANKSTLGELTVSATADIVADHEMAKDSARWFRFDWDSLQRHRDGITLDAAGLPPLINVAAKIIPAPSPEQADRQWLDATRDVHVKTASVLGLIAVRDLYDRAVTLKAGRLWQRLHLWATARGLAAQPLNQAPERVDREAELGRPPRMAEALARLTGDANWRPTFAFRMGYADRAAGPSPRRPVAAVVSQFAKREG
jgi:nitroreductase